MNLRMSLAISLMLSGMDLCLVTTTPLPTDRTHGQ